MDEEEALDLLKKSIEEDILKLLKESNKKVPFSSGKALVGSLEKHKELFELYE